MSIVTISYHVPYHNHHLLKCQILALLSVSPSIIANYTHSHHHRYCHQVIVVNPVVMIITITIIDIILLYLWQSPTRYHTLTTIYSSAKYWHLFSLSPFITTNYTRSHHRRHYHQIIIVNIVVIIVTIIIVTITTIDVVVIYFYYNNLPPGTIP